MAFTSGSSINACASAYHLGTAMSRGVIPRQIAIAAHDRHKFRVLRLLQRGAALHFGDIAAAYDAPAYGVHNSHSAFTQLNGSWSLRGSLTNLTRFCA